MHQTVEFGKRTLEPRLEPLTDDVAARKRDALMTLMRWGALRAALRSGVVPRPMLDRALDAALGGTLHTWE